jgi:hypothetical protein
MRITYSVNIGKYNNIMNNTKEYKLKKRKDKTIIIIQDKTNLSLAQHIL